MCCRALRRFALCTIVALASCSEMASADQPGKSNPQTVTVRGKIAELRPAEGEVRIRTRGGEELMFHVKPESRLQIRQHEAMLADFHQGQRVRVVYDPSDPTNRIVSMVSPAISLEDVRKEFNEALESAKAYGYQEKEAYARKLQPVLQDLDERIEDLKARGAEMGAQARQVYSRELQDLQQKRDVVRQKLEQARAAAPGAWEEMKAGVRSAIEDLQRATERARARMSQSGATESEEHR